MKSFKKVVAALLAAVLLISATSCNPVSLTKQWGFKYSDKLLTTQQDIGVYIYAMYQAYNSAANYAKDAKGYKEGESFLDLKIKDDNDKEAVASKWIKEEAEKIAVSVIALDYLMKKHETTYDKKDMETAKETAQDTWDMGPEQYVSMGYYMPMNKELEDHGVSVESFFEGSYACDVKQTALFKDLYDKKGEQEVSDKDLTKFFKENYVNYSFIPVNMYSEIQDESGNTSTEAFKEKEMKKVEDYLKDYATKISNGSTTVDKAFKAITKKYNVAEGQAQQDSVSYKEDLEANNADISKALKNMKNGEAKLITVGKDGDSPKAYIVVKNDISKSVKDYVEKEDNRFQVLSNCKKEDLTDYIDKTTDELLKSKALTKNTSVLDRYDPEIFYDEPEETTDAQ